MESTAFWEDLGHSVSSQPVLWNPKQKRIGITDKLLQYLITYHENSAVAWESVRTFCGREKGLFAGWSEVRVASIREIEDILRMCGAKNHTWELAVTIRDFLQNAYDTIFTIDLDEFKKSSNRGELLDYIKQLEGRGTVFKSQQPTPYRPNYSTFNRRKLREAGDPVLPNPVIDHLKYLWGIADTPSFDFYSRRILNRVGVIDSEADYSAQIQQYGDFLSKQRPVSKHRMLLTLGKLVCNSEPRCHVCPVAKHCKSAS